MPLRQTLLNFYRGRVENPKSATGTSSESRPVLVRTPSSASSETDPDTIVVLPDPPRQQQLPTPSESSVDVSAHDAQAMTMNEVPKGRARRVSRRLANNQSQAGLIEQVQDELAKGRSVSGETLVNLDNASQSTLLKEGVAALDLPWNMSGVFTDKGHEALLAEKSAKVNETEQMPDDAEDAEEERIRREKAAAKKAKMDENNKSWEQRRKAADKQATRRSSRVPVLEKAGELMSSFANSVLGKRKDRVAELHNSSRPESMGGTESTSEEPIPKKRRVSEGDAPVPDEPVQPRQPARRREKKWLTSGLYAGQPRTFDGRLTESKNKRKSTTVAEPPRENRVLPLPMFAAERVLKQGRDFKLPFDVFSPLPAGQPKPDEWKKVNKNVFVGDAAQAWRVDKFEEHSSCLCKAETGCDHNCMNRYMYYECDDKNCDLNPEQCGNRAFEGLRQRVKKGGKYNIGVEVIKTEDRGYGVRSNRMFDPNQIIVEYTGEIITQEECEHRMRKMYKNNECYYLMLFDQNMIIDATRGSIARFVNHSCEPNCRMEKWTVNGKPRMALFAGERGIMTGEELTYDYNFDPYSQKNVQECRCGAEKCRGVLGPRPKEDRKQKSPDVEVIKGRSKLAGAKRKLADALEGTTSRVTKKMKVSSTQTATISTRKASSAGKVQKGNVIRKVVSKKTSATVIKGLSRRPSKLKTLVAAAKGKTVKGRVVSNTSTTALIERESPKRTAKTLSRSSSLRAKASSVRSRVVRTVRGAPSGRTRSIRPVVGAGGDENVEI
ncbi:histone-lysine N-methyltransferase ASH1L [Cladophialophora yegresii CBS 114405]|uniref:Histone-lysine N-methyltransferase ASH1L n=1 Tax=Cladophialophora yegresii CBS 114405 TaxID=1182544 RepID=W9W284_9EURO|nr:histone-lysine N-methyltransferase ASH1L [Cladophialophora yegresii CBS 114405]EXJ62182.1 histone-lysine N-methyltransferase ASH1L [Cladophialophora yegresii CBS 114405]